MLTQMAGDGAPVTIAEIAMGRTLNVDGKLQPLKPCPKPAKT